MITVMSAESRASKWSRMFGTHGDERLEAVNLDCETGMRLTVSTRPRELVLRQLQNVCAVGDTGHIV